jgi:hypothetical protein
MYRLDTSRPGTLFFLFFLHRAGDVYARLCAIFKKAGDLYADGLHLLHVLYISTLKGLLFLHKLEIGDLYVRLYSPSVQTKDHCARFSYFSTQAGDLFSFRLPLHIWLETSTPFSILFLYRLDTSSDQLPPSSKQTKDFYS